MHLTGNKYCSLLLRHRWVTVLSPDVLLVQFCSMLAKGIAHILLHFCFQLESASLKCFFSEGRNKNENRTSRGSWWSSMTLPVRVWASLFHGGLQVSVHAWILRFLVIIMTLRFVTQWAVYSMSDNNLRAGFYWIFFWTSLQNKLFRTEIAFPQLTRFGLTRFFIKCTRI
jgi:hypothetical protein